MNTPSKGLRLARALILKEGEISLDEIAALPYVDDQETAYAIALALINLLGAEHVHERSFDSDGRSFLREVIRIRPDVEIGMAALADD